MMTLPDRIEPEQTMAIVNDPANIANLHTRIDREAKRRDALLDFTHDTFRDHAETLDDLTGWIRNIVSSLHDDPFPPPTADEWEEAVSYDRSIANTDALAKALFGPDATLTRADKRWTVTRSRKVGNRAAADTLMGVVGYTRTEDECECDCCQWRKADPAR